MPLGRGSGRALASMAGQGDQQGAAGCGVIRLLAKRQAPQLGPRLAIQREVKQVLKIKPQTSWAYQMIDSSCHHDPAP